MYDLYNLVCGKREPYEAAMRNIYPVNVEKSDLETRKRQARGLCDKNYGM